MFNVFVRKNYKTNTFLLTPQEFCLIRYKVTGIAADVTNADEREKIKNCH
jgi:hypothetical protein